jgi:hypothetical protein
MPNPYHDADGKFASRDELKNTIQNAQDRGDMTTYMRERENLENIEKGIEQAKEDKLSKKEKLSNDETWEYNFNDYGDFMRWNGRAPHSDSIDDGERRLANWYNNTRNGVPAKTAEGRAKQKERKERLKRTYEQQANPRQNAWEQKFFDYTDFVEKEGYIPSASATDPEEKHLATWRANTENQKARTPEAEERRQRNVKLLEDTHPKTHEMRKASQQWRQSYVAYGEFLVEHKRHPSTRKDASDDEKRLAVWRVNSLTPPNPKMGEEARLEKESQARAINLAYPKEEKKK